MGWEVGAPRSTKVKICISEAHTKQGIGSRTQRRSNFEIGRDKDNWLARMMNGAEQSYRMTHSQATFARTTLIASSATNDALGNSQDSVDQGK